MSRFKIAVFVQFFVDPKQIGLPEGQMPTEEQVTGYYYDAVEKMLKPFTGMDESNPQAQMEFWETLGFIEPEDYERLLFGYEGGKVIAAFVTQTGEWVQGPKIYDFEEKSGHADELRQWDWRIVRALDENQECAPFLVECHV